jgi:CRP-like cAMP-binding protein
VKRTSTKVLGTLEETMLETVTDLDHGPHVTRLSNDLVICQTAPGEHIQCLVDVAEELVHSPGEIIVKAGQQSTGLYVLLEGTARVVYSVATPPHPRLAVVDLVGSGRLFGLAQALDGEPYVGQLEAVTQVRILFVTIPAFLDELAKHPEVAKNLVLQLASFTRKMESWLISSL